MEAMSVFLMMIFCRNYGSVWLEVTFAQDKYKYVWSADFCLRNALACKVVKPTACRIRVPDTQGCPITLIHRVQQALQEILLEAPA